jgi:hypothetical protein
MGGEHLLQFSLQPVLSRMEAKPAQQLLSTHLIFPLDLIDACARPPLLPIDHPRHAH